MTCNTSKKGMGVVQSFGENWEMAWPAAFNSIQLSVCQKNYPVHKKELLAIVRALTKRRLDLLGTKFNIYSGHRMLEHFMM